MLPPSSGFNPEDYLSSLTMISKLMKLHSVYKP